MQQPLTPFSSVICPTENCNTDITYKFNLLRLATFNVVQRRYTELEEKIGGLKPSRIDTKTLDILTRHRKGQVSEAFDIKCDNCKKRHLLKMNTFTGEVTCSDGSIFMGITPQPNESPSQIIPTGNIGPDFQGQKQFPPTGLSLNCPLVFAPDHEFICRYPQGAH